MTSLPNTEPTEQPHIFPAYGPVNHFYAAEVIDDAGRILCSVLEPVERHDNPNEWPEENDFYHDVLDDAATIDGARWVVFDPYRDQTTEVDLCG